MPPPATFNEKVRYKMLADRRPLLRTFADKLAVRAYVEARVGAGVLTELYAVTDVPETLVQAEIPREFVLKPTHASGAVVVVADFAPFERELPVPPARWAQSLVRPERVCWDRLIGLARDWVSRDYERDARTYAWREWAYRDLPRRILVEQLLEDGGEVPRDFKFFVFHGRVRMVQVDSNRFDVHARSLYTPSWERLDAKSAKYPHGGDTERPGQLAEMIEIAAALGAETDFVRVDLYCLPERVVFGELTNYPEAAAGFFEPPELDRWLGQWWAPPRRYGS